jgi:hypothetical protein
MVFGMLHYGIELESQAESRHPRKAQCNRRRICARSSIDSEPNSRICALVQKTWIFESDGRLELGYDDVDVLVAPCSRRRPAALDLVASRDCFLSLLEQAF